jgi:hypothetical protein
MDLMPGEPPPYSGLITSSCRAIKSSVVGAHLGRSVNAWQAGAEYLRVHAQPSCPRGQIRTLLHQMNG